MSSDLEIYIYINNWNYGWSLQSNSTPKYKFCVNCLLVVNDVMTSILKFWNWMFCSVYISIKYTTYIYICINVRAKQRKERVLLTHLSEDSFWDFSSPFLVVAEEGVSDLSVVLNHSVFESADHLFGRHQTASTRQVFVYQIRPAPTQTVIN